ncbi:MAG: glycoside hydrolase family 2 TIM barrel-domain containing protein, partial [Verrucomicrobiota bacterium]
MNKTQIHMHTITQALSRAILLPVLVLTANITISNSLRADPAATPVRAPINLSGLGWQFAGVSEKDILPVLDSAEFKKGAWTEVTVPHVFQTRDHFNDLQKGWYRRTIQVDPSLTGKELYLVFEGAAAIAEVNINGQHLGQHRGAYTRFVFDATAALHPGADNQLDVAVDNSPEITADCLPCRDGLYKVWGGLYRKVWLVALDPLHIDPTDDGAPGVYLTPTNVSDQSADLKVRVLLRNVANLDAAAEVRVQVLDPNGVELRTLKATVHVPAKGRAPVELSTTLAQPQLWEPRKGLLYQVRASVYRNGQKVDEVTESTGFRTVSWDWNAGRVTVNGKTVILTGANLHQEIESKASAVSDEDLEHNFDIIRDLGLNFLRLPHYPHARLEYDLCDQNGLLCWAENGNSNKNDVPSPIAAQITTEMVKQNYNHPSIVVWSVGNEASPETADQCVPIVRALDASRPVVVANMKSN